MRGGDKRTGELFSYVDLEKRVRSDHPLRAIRGRGGKPRRSRCRHALPACAFVRRIEITGLLRTRSTASCHGNRLRYCARHWPAARPIRPVA